MQRAFENIVGKGLVRLANGLVLERKQDKTCRIWLSGNKINLL